MDHLARRDPGARVRLIVVGPGEGSGLIEFPSAPGAFLEARGAAELDRWWREELAARSPRGSSRLDVALERALALAPDRVLCYTDGVPVAAPEPGTAPAVGDTAAARIERARARILADVRCWNRGSPVTPVDVVGVGAGLPGTREFLRELAAQTGGYFVATD